MKSGNLDGQNEIELKKMFVKEMKEIVDDKIFWNKQVVHLWKKAPDGISEIRKILKDLNDENILKKYNELKKFGKDRQPKEEEFYNNPDSNQKPVTRKIYDACYQGIHDHGEKYGGRIGITMISEVKREMEPVISKEKKQKLTGGFEL